MRKKRSKILGGTVILAVVVICIAFVFLTPFFSMSNRTLYGNSIVSAEEIWEAAGFTRVTERMGGLRQYPHFFSLTAAQMENGILKLPYIKTATVTKSFPNAVTIHVTERTVSGYVLYQDMTFIYIDEFGMALEARTYMERNLPFIIGLNITHFQVGQYLAVDNPASFSVAVELTQLFKEHGLEIDRIDVSNIFNIRLFIDNMDVLFGNMDNANIKLRNLAAILTLQYPYRVPSIRGTLDIRNIARDPVFTPMR